MKKREQQVRNSFRRVICLSIGRNYSDIREKAEDLFLQFHLENSGLRRGPVSVLRGHYCLWENVVKDLRRRYDEKKGERVTS